MPLLMQDWLALFHVQLAGQLPEPIMPTPDRQGALDLV